METIELLVRGIFLIGFMALLSFLLLIIYAKKRAIDQTTLPIPGFWKVLISLCFILILGSIVFILLVPPQS